VIHKPDMQTPHRGRTPSFSNTRAALRGPN